MGFTVTCAELPVLIRQLRLVDKQLALEAKRGIRKAERPAIRAVQASATAAGMNKAARSVKPSNRFTGKQASLGLKVDARIAPNARPLDKGSRGSGGAYDRHPVHGHTWRVDQPTRPFFSRGSVAAFDACQDEMEEALGAVVSFLGRG